MKITRFEIARGENIWIERGSPPGRVLCGVIEFRITADGEDWIFSALLDPPDEIDLVTANNLLFSATRFLKEKSEASA